MIDLDALLGETDEREMKYKGESFVLPSEIPGECLAPLLSEDLGLVERLADVLNSTDEEKSPLDLVLDVIKSEPRYPLRVLAAIKESFAILLGDEYERFQAKRPGLNAYISIALALPEEYGLDLADFFGSSESSESDGTDSKQTSDTTTPDSTPETSGDTPTPESTPAPVADEQPAETPTATPQPQDTAEASG